MLNRGWGKRTGHPIYPSPKKSNFLSVINALLIGASKPSVFRYIYPPEHPEK